MNTKNNCAGNIRCPRWLLAGSMIALFLAPITAQSSGITVYEKEDSYVNVGGLIQIQYHYVDPDGGDSTDELKFRRLRPYIEGGIHKVWVGKFQFDFGQFDIGQFDFNKANGNYEITIKDAYLQYKGFANTEVLLGNANFPFSRELLTSSKYQELVERTFVGDHNYGTPDKDLGLHLTGNFMDRKLTWGASFALASIDPDANKLDFDTPVNENDDFNEGFIYGGRIDFHPYGYLKFSQGDFDRDKMLATIGIAAFGWNNDDDNNTYTENGMTISSSDFDVDSVAGFELSGAFRSAGFSVDIEYNIFKAETVDPMATGGLFRNGGTDLKNFAVEGGYMIIPDKLEFAAGWQTQNADNYEDHWNRTEFGVNYFFRGNDIKLQFTYRIGYNLDGITDNDENELFLQAQYVF